MSCRQSEARCRRGLTVIEVCIAVGLLVMVLGAIFAVTTSGMEAAYATVSLSEADRTARHVLDTITHELLAAGADSPALALASGDGTFRFSFNQAVGYDPDTGETLWSGARAFEWDETSGEVSFRHYTDVEGTIEGPSSVIAAGVLILTGVLEDGALKLRVSVAAEETLDETRGAIRITTVFLRN